MRLIDETDGILGNEWGSDEIHLAGYATDPFGITTEIGSFEVDDFNEGKYEVKIYDPPRLFAQFDLADGFGWPRRYTTALS